MIVTPVMLTDRRYRHLFRNRAFYEQIGYGFDEVHDRDSWFDVAFPDADYRNEAKRLWDGQLIDKGQGGDPVKLQVRIRCKNGDYRWYEIHEYELAKYKVVSFVDVNEIQLRNNQLLKTIKFNNLLNATIAHDIRSPLATLRSLIQFKDTAGYGSETKMKQLLGRINNQISRVFDILDSSVIHHGDELNHFTFTKQRIPLKPFIEKIQSYYEEEMNGQGLGWNTLLDGHETVHYDLFVLEVIVRNILSNAIKHTRPHERITVGMARTGYYTDIFIEDKGGGIAQEAIDLIMKPLSYHQHTERQDLRMGFGIGMLLAKEILESHWGRLIIEPNPPIGSTFRIRIPAYIPEFDEAPDNRPERNE